MSPTWTPSALKSEARTGTGKVWRVVEHQHTHSTRKLVDTQQEQQDLEDILDATKPKYPDEVAHFDYLLKTPFRYAPVNPYGSRFRKPRSRAGVFYASESLRSALAETAYYRLRFFKASHSKLLPRPREQLTAFTVRYKTRKRLDLTKPELNRDSRRWTSLKTYAHTQMLAAKAREAGIEAIRYTSVRDRERGANVAIMQPSAFECRAPIDRQTWYFYLSEVEINFVRAHADNRDDLWTFDREFFESMPMIRA